VVAAFSLSSPLAKLVKNTELVEKSKYRCLTWSVMDITSPRTCASARVASFFRPDGSGTTVDKQKIPFLFDDKKMILLILMLCRAFQVDQYFTNKP